MTTRFFYRGLVPLAVTLLIVASLVRTGSGQANGGAVSIDNDDIGGVVTGARGPEAGVWVIAETRDLPTKLVKMVVTDDQGRYLLPDLPKANYDVWVRGYGLVDSPKIAVGARKDREPEGGSRARCQGSGRVLPGAVLVLRCCSSRRRATSPAPARRATASRRT